MPPKRYRNFSDFERDMDASLCDTTDFDKLYGLDTTYISDEYPDDEREEDDE